MIHIVHVNIMPLKELLDPQGKAVNESLHNLGLQSIQNVRIGKHITLFIEAESKEAANAIADEATKKMLYNAVMENYTITVE